MNAIRRIPFRRSLWAALSVLAVSLSGFPVALADPPAVLDRIPTDADAILAVGSVSRLDQNTSQLLTAIELNAISTLSQALGAMGLRDGLDLTGSAAGVFFNNHVAGDAPTTRFVLLLPVSDLNRFLTNLNAQPDAPGHRFDYAGATYFARDLGAGLAAFGPDRDLVVSFDAAPGRLDAHMAPFGPRGRELASRSDLVAISELRSLEPLLVAVLGPMLQGMPGAGLTTAMVGADPRNRFASAFLDQVIEQTDRALLCIQTSPLGLRVDCAVPFKQHSELATLSKATPSRPSGLNALPRLDYFFYGSMNLTHPGLRRLFLTALTPPLGENEPQDALLTARNAISADSASIAVYTPQSFMLGALTRTALSWEAPDAAIAAAAFRSYVLSMHGQETDAPPARVTAQVTGAEPPFTVPVGETVDQWVIGFPPGSTSSNPILFGFGAGPSGFLGVSPTRGVITLSRDRELLIACLDAARAPNPAHAATSDIMLSQVAALLPPDRCIEWYLNARPFLLQMLPMIAATQNAPAQRLPEALPPIGASISLADGSLHASAFIPAPLMRVAAGVIGRLNMPAAQPARERNARPR